MLKRRSLDRALDDCLDRVLVAGDRLEDCLSRYPEQAAELEPLLRAALGAQQTWAPEADARSKAQARLRLGQALEERRRRRAQRSPIWLRLSGRWAIAAAAALAVAVVSAIGGGTVAASTDSVPREPLYGVKRKVETVHLFFTVGSDNKARLYATLVDRRMTEMATMVEAGRPIEVELLVRDVDNHLRRIKVLAGVTISAQDGVSGLSRENAAPTLAPTLPATGPGVTYTPGIPAAARDTYPPDPSEVLRRNFELRVHRLLVALEHAPPEARPQIERAIRLTRERYDRALEEIRRQEAQKRERREGRKGPQNERSPVRQEPRQGERERPRERDGRDRKEMPLRPTPPPKPRPGRLPLEQPSRVSAEPKPPSIDGSVADWSTVEVSPRRHQDT